MGEQRLIWNDEMKLRLIKVQLLGQQDAKACNGMPSPAMGLQIQGPLPCCTQHACSMHSACPGLHSEMGDVMQRIAADTLDIGEAEMEVRLEQLVEVLPDILPRMSTMKPETVARLAANPQQLAEKLLQLKTLLPEANAGQMIARRPSLALSKDLQGDVAERVAQLRELLPGAAVDR